MAEVRGLKRNNEQLHQDLEALQLQQHAADQKVAQLLATGAGQDGEPERKRPRPPTSSPISSSSSSSSSPQPPTPSTLGSPSPLFEARRLIAFVGPYILPSNFAVPDFRYPVMGCTFESVFGLGPPTIVFANTEFCKLTEFRLHELLGAPITKVRVTGENSRQHMSAHLTNKTPMSVSPVFEINCLVRCRSGRLLRTQDKTQFFFDEQGNVKHAILCLLSWKEGQLQADERLEQWRPIKEERTDN